MLLLRIRQLCVNVLRYNVSGISVARTGVFATKIEKIR